MAVGCRNKRLGKQECLERLRKCLNSKDPPQPNRRIFITFPGKIRHKGHPISEEIGFTKRIHPLIKEKIYDFVGTGVTSSPIVKSMLKCFVADLCKNDNIKPKLTDRGYYPTNRDIQNHIHNALVAGLNSAIDLHNVRFAVDKWQEDDPTCKMFLRDATEVETDTAIKEPSEMRNGHEFLFVHQTGAQRQLLRTYGNMVLLDATYKTSKYALPLFVMAVRTNVGYKPVAQFVVEHERTANIQEALSLIKQWMDEEQPESWKPRYNFIELRSF